MIVFYRYRWFLDIGRSHSRELQLCSVICHESTAQLLSSHGLHWGVERMDRTPESHFHRRTPRFGLSTFLVLVTAVAVSFGLFTREWHRAHRKQQAAQKIELSGGRVTWGEPPAAKSKLFRTVKSQATVNRRSQRQHSAFAGLGRRRRIHAIRPSCNRCARSVSRLRSVETSFSNDSSKQGDWEPLWGSGIVTLWASAHHGLGRTRSTIVILRDTAASDA